ncbi:MAG: RagB/SusD family nutrient uptake outer membrane protein [Longimicrobiales bacterium]
MMRKMTLVALLFAGLVASGCDLDLSDPNSPTEEAVFGDGQNLILVAIGLQAEAAAMMGPQIFVSSLTADEMGAGSASFDNFKAADAGDDLVAGQYLSEAPWAAAYRVNKLAEDLLEAVPGANLRAGTRSGVLAMAKLFKAMAFAHLATLFEAAPIDAGIDKPDAEFALRTEVLAEAINLLTSARSDIAAEPLSDEFRDDVQATGFDVEVTIYAMLARYNLMLGNYAEAASEAQSVPPAARSEFRFSAADQNPVYTIAYNSGNAWQVRARQELRLNAESGDERVDFWVSAANIQGASRTLDDLAKYRAPDESFAVFLPDEMKLIRAEAAARNSDLAAAITLINEVRTQCDVTGEPAACLNALDSTDLPTQQAVLDEILEQRRYELYLQGLRLDDLRRFDVQRKYDFLPLPQSECDRNASAPC